MNQRPSRTSVLVPFVLIGLAAITILAAQDVPVKIQHQTGTVAIEIPVRIFKGDAFVDHLTIADFEVAESGRPQTLDAVYLVKRTVIERKEDSREFAPDTGRHFYLFFEMTEYDPKVREALDFFVHQVLLPGDDLVVVTPLKTYRMRSDILRDAGRDAVFERVLGLLRRDILIGNADYNNVIEDMQGLAASMAAAIGVNTTDQQTQTMSNPFAGTDSLFEVKTSVEEQLQLYAGYLTRLENLRSIDAARVHSLAEHLRDQAGQKEVYLFYQREFIPKVDPTVLNTLMAVYNERPDIVQTASSVFEFFRRDTPLDVETVKRSYADSGASIHFLYLTRPAPKARGVKMEEQSEDIFSPFLEMSRATGGYVSSTANIAAAMKSAVEASENYYLLYYTPKDYRADGGFRAITVKVKGGGYRVSHRQGYIAD